MSQAKSDPAVARFSHWYNSLAKYQGSFPARGTIGGALIVLQHLKTKYDLSIDSHTAPGGSQIQGASGVAVQAILADFGEYRQFLSEGGRTNRGLRGDITSMLQALVDAELSDNIAERNTTLTEMQRYLVEKVQEYHNRQRIKFIFNPLKSTAQLIADLLILAEGTNKRGAVAQYLVGAKLQARFPDIPVSNDSYSTADQQLGRHGDFYIGDTVFHVTVTPFPAVFEKCRKNVENGLSPYLLVPQDQEPGAISNAKLTLPGQLTVISIETFVAQNIDELSKFSRTLKQREINRLLSIYNERVDQAESDKSLMIDIPANLHAE